MKQKAGLPPLLTFAFCLLTFDLPFHAAEKYDVRRHYQKFEHMVPMRDGVRLHTTVYAPRKTSEKLPFLVVRTPYGTGPYGPEGYRSNLGPSPHSFEFEEEGFF